METKVKKPILITAAILVILLIVTFLSNPTMDDFSNWLKQEISKNEEAADTEMAFATMFMDAIVNNFTTRKDYKFFSIYTMNIDSEEGVVLGILNSFIKLGKTSK